MEKVTSPNPPPPSLNPHPPSPPPPAPTPTKKKNNHPRQRCVMHEITKSILIFHYTYSNHWPNVKRNKLLTNTDTLQIISLSLYFHGCHQLFIGCFQHNVSMLVCFLCDSIPVLFSLKITVKHDLWLLSFKLKPYTIDVSMHGRSRYSKRIITQSVQGRFHHSSFEPGCAKHIYMRRTTHTLFWAETCALLGMTALTGDMVSCRYRDSCPIPPLIKDISCKAIIFSMVLEPAQDGLYVMKDLCHR